MTLTSVAASKLWLKSRHIIVPDDWLEACVDWISEENQGEHLSQQQLNNLIFEQWLLADLHELGTKCLPDEVKSATKYQLTGSYALQVDSMVDVSTPFYGQLQKVQGTLNDNVKITAEPPPPWEPKPTRMLMLNLTDGCLNLKGMEYQGIPCLNQQVKPGCKILIQGNILCRRGVLMLTGNNIKILGGEVDTLIEMNTDENIIKSAMEEGVKNAGKEYHQEFAGGPVVNLKHDKKLSNIKLELSQKNSTSNAIAPQCVTKCELTVKEELVKIEDWADDEIMEEFMDDMDDFEMSTIPQAPPPFPNHTIRAIDKEHRNKHFDAQRPCASREPIKSFDNSKSHVVHDISYGRQSEISRPSISNFAKPNENIGSYQKHGNTRGYSTNDNDSAVTVYKGSASDTRSENVNKCSRRETDFDDFDISSLDKNQNNTVKNNTDKSSDTDNYCDSGDFSGGGISTNIQPKMKTDNRSMGNYSDTGGLSRRSDPEDFQVSECSMVKRRKLFSKEISLKVEPEAGNCEGQDVSSLQSKEAMNNLIHKNVPVAIAEPLESYTNIKYPGVAQISELPLDAVPFTYIAVVKKNLPTSHSIKFKVKAYVSTLIGRLERPGYKHWSLSCKINDGSGCMDVSLSDQVLTRMIGFSAQETMEMKNMSPDSCLVQRLTKGIKHCQQSIINLLHIMEIHITPGNAKPEVVALSEFSSEDLYSLKNRVSSALSKLQDKKGPV